jgi:acetoin:2,6-dichlorophenolindophenol oxidoreductase subunit alpha
MTTHLPAGTGLTVLEEAPLRPLADADLQRLLLIRHFELLLLDLFGRGLVHGTTHTCLGQEHVPVVLAPLLREDDVVLSHHRGHGHYLARFDDCEGLLAEILGREGGIACGVGGSQHIHRPGQHLSTGVQGESLPLAVGLALHFRRTALGRLAVAFVGDGTFGEGTVYEAFNMAALWSLPLLVVVEHNHIAQSTPTSLQMAGDIASRARAFGIGHLGLSGVDVSALRERAASVVEDTRHRPRPFVLEFDTQRLGPHSKGDDTRDAATLAAIRVLDWLPRYRSADPVRFERVEAAVRAKLAGVLQDVERRPASRWLSR